MRSLSWPILAIMLGVFVSLSPDPALGSRHIFDGEQTGEIERILRDYFLKNPEIMLEALQVLENRRRLAEQERLQNAVSANMDELTNDPGSPVGGNPDGDVTIVEFFDYRCPYCKAVAPRLDRLLSEDNEIRFVYKEWPILGPVSEFAARAALAAMKQDKYEPFHKAVMTAKGQLTEDMVIDYTRRLDLDQDQLMRDMESPEVDAILNRNQDLAERLGITGTPAFVVGETLVPGAASLVQLKALVRQARKGG